MTKQKIEKTYNVNVMRVGNTIKRRKYVAFRGGNGTGAPVVDVAEAYTLAALARRVERWVNANKNS